MNPSGAGRRHRCGAGPSPQTRRRNPMVRGAFSHCSVGEVVRYARAAGQPEGRMFFAGEHAMGRIPGMEGAPASGLRTADQALQALRGG